MKLKLNEIITCGVLFSLLIANLCNFFGVAKLFADSYVGGEINQNTTWYLNGSPYIVISDVTICGAGSGQSATLVIQPGVQVKFLPNTGMFVGKKDFFFGYPYYGALIAQGTSSQPISFTSNLTSPFPGAWNSIYFRDQTNDTLTVLDYCNFDYAGNSSLYNTALYFEFASPTITNSVISNSGGYGIYSDNNSGPTLTVNQYLNNTRYPISTNPNGVFNVTQSTGSGNNPNAIEVRGGEVTDDITWTRQDFPYELSSNITICDYNQIQTATLTINPGTRIQFRPQTGIYVGKPPYYRGALNAQGTPSQAITFTSYNSTAPLSGDWNNLYFTDLNSDTLTILDYSNIEYGGGSNATNATVYFESSSPLISNSIISNSKGYGMYSDDNSGAVLTANQFLNNARYPISSSPNGIMNITQSTGSGNNPNAIEVRGGEVTSDITWTQQNFPYEVSSDITICDYNQTQTAALLINPGVSIRFRPQAGMFIGKPPDYKGALIAQGTETQPISFTSYNTTSPQVGDWNSLYFTNQANSNLTNLDFCTVEYGGNFYNATLYYKGTSPQVSRSNIRNSFGYGIYSNTTDANPVIHNSNIINNSLGGIYNTNTTSTNTTVQAQYNWWQDASGPSGAGPGTGQWISNNVEYEPWLGQSFSLQFYLDNISVSPQKFSQNGGWATFSMDISEPANWTITINDAMQQLVRTFQGSGSQITQNWYGDDNNLQPLPNGTYIYTVSAESMANPGTTASLIGGELILDNALSIAKITLPQFYDFLGNNLLASQFQIMGTASGTNFSSYTLEYGLGEYPTQWNTITSSSSPVVNGLLGTWDATGLSGSVYTIRLTVTNTAQATATDLVTIRLLAVYNLYDSTDPFSPNNDGIKDDTTIGAEFSHLSDWLLNITDSSQQTVRTFTGTNSSSLSQLWNGKDNSQQTLASGNYTYQIQITEPSSGVPSFSQTGTSYIDNTAPTAVITTPPSGGYISGLVTIIGTADDLNFESYKVEYGIGANPTNWFIIQNTTNTPVINNTLTTWDVTNFSNGNYIIRLTVKDTVGNISILNVPVIIGNIQITNVSVNPYLFNPSNNEIVNINYTIDRNANVTTIIQDLFYNIIKLIGPNSKLAGPNTDIWNGLNQTGNITADGAYTFTLNVTDGTSFGDYTPAYIPYAVGVTGFTLDTGFDPYNNELCNITYSLADYAQVLIKAGGTGGNDPNWAIVNWEPRLIGPNIDYWNGRDPNNNIVNLNTSTLAIWTQALPDEPMIVVSGLTVSVSTDPYSFIPAYGEFTTITYTISKTANVTVSLYDSQGALVKVLENNVAKQSGTYNLIWDGTDAQGKPVCPPANYTIKVQATGGDGKTTIAFANVSVY